MRAAAAIATAVLLTGAGSALAKDATCYTTDDGEYECAFESLDADGSFRISAPGRPTFELWIDAPGRGYVTATFEKDGRAVALPGVYLRSEEDGACWVSDATATELCAW